MCEIRERHHVELHHLPETLRGLLDEGAVDSEAGVVDEDVHVYAERRDRRDQTPRTPGLGEVARDDARADAVTSFDLRCERVEPTHATRGEDAVVAAAREIAGDARAD